MVEDASSFWSDIQRYEDMLAADPHSCCFAPLSELYRKLGLLDDAISVAQKGCETHPDYWGGFIALGAACYDKGLNTEARQALERVLLLKPDYLPAKKLLGQLYAGGGEIPLAKKMLGQVLRQHPDDLESEVLLRSLPFTAAAAESDEEFLEEAEVIEELTDVVDEPPFYEEAAPPVSAEVADLRRSSQLSTSDLSEEEFWEMEAPGSSDAARSPARKPLMTATLAELFASQGFINKALAVFKALIAEDPANQGYRLRAAELMDLSKRLQEAPSASLAGNRPLQQKVPAPQGELEVGLSSWLDNIRRRRDGL